MSSVGLITAVAVWIAVEDARHRRVPNSALLCLLLLRLALLNHLPISAQALFGALVVFAVFWLPYTQNKMGAGDIKYMMTAMLYFSPAHMLYGGLSILVVGGVVSLVGKVVFKQTYVAYSYSVTPVLLAYVYWRVLW